ncbi:hypothetical protein K432DRAFT_471012 [Lepidopterella palustris CBS 459.81]|uniref:F-box domain-containing protein n=1 Tax=Lepidopterella palustris CBS 459.81 TaxID=1314670 RepID=A0A8E2J9C2_9PEZI|nr:hypothetical protein K432DRAFT_471012 [Lepidopterella palustris CBS 459.81]
MGWQLRGSIRRSILNKQGPVDCRACLRHSPNFPTPCDAVIVAASSSMFNSNIRDHTAALGNRPSITVFPLKVIAIIVSHLDNVADLARVCRSCRLLNYMALPLLYHNLCLTTYDKVNHRDDQENQSGDGNFSAGINAIVTKGFGPMVHSLALQGEWNEDWLKEHVGLGMAPNMLVILNIAVRAAIDKMPCLESFSWELNNKTLDSVYFGLSHLPKLTSLSLRFPSLQRPHPITVIPAMPYLTSLKVTNIDPLSYPDDISALLLCSKKLKELKMSWSPRTKHAQKQPSVTLHDYFHKCIAAKSSMKIKRLTFQNLHPFYTGDLTKAMDQEAIEEITILNSSSSCFKMLLVERNSQLYPLIQMPRLRCMRQDAPSKEHCEFLNTTTGLEKIYFVSNLDKSGVSDSPQRATIPSPPLDSDTIRVASNGAPASYFPEFSAVCPKAQDLLRDSYFSAIITNHGQSLRHLLLSSSWLLSTSMIARLVHACPNLEQLGFATETSSFDTMGLLVPFLRKLVAIRILIHSREPGANGAALKSRPTPVRPASLPVLARPLIEVVELGESVHIEKIGEAFADQEVFGNIKLVGLGWKAYQLGDSYMVRDSGPRPLSTSASPAVHVDHNRRLSKPTARPKAVPPPILGKRTRELRSSPTTSMQKQPSGNSAAPAIPATESEVDIQNSGTDAPGGAVTWRRRLWPVGWDVLKHWEIWSMDELTI